MITIINAKGSPKDIGYAVGKAVAASVHSAVLNNHEFSETADLFLGSDYLKALNDAARQAYPHHMAELEAMAEAIEIDAETLFLWNCRGDLRFPPDTAQARIDALADGCTTIMAPGDFDAGKPAIIAHNEDGSGDFMAHRYWLRATPDDGPAFESYLYPGMMPGHSVGVNAAGLVQTINNVRPDDLKPGIPRHFICRAILETDSIPGVIEHLRRDDRASGFHHAIGMRGEASPMSIEAPASKTVIQSLSEPTAHANHLLDDTFSELDQVVTSSSAYRQSTVDGYLAEGGDAHTPENILFQRGKNVGDESVLRRPGDGGDDYGCTLVTAVFHIHADTVTWSVHGGPDERDMLTGRYDA